MFEAQRALLQEKWKEWVERNNRRELLEEIQRLEYGLAEFVLTNGVKAPAKDGTVHCFVPIEGGKESDGYRVVLNNPTGATTVEELLEAFDGQLAFHATAITSAAAKSATVTFNESGFSRLDYYSHIDPYGRIITHYDSSIIDGNSRDPVPDRALEGYRGAMRLIDRAFSQHFATSNVASH